ncbi:hypothetical protein [Rhodococcus sp. IEGM 1379]|uniref:hypothetical protein n=1 Tax=Rhodococcus sp. IEGM 1379 TaxID=3047086 RepID=UPI0024B6B5A9|nr:hypothetical protein [Rhodococcus sp. IEGM 1379]MDI9916899.1 hypothetical protein [Rhodococcus sp. IEGM 1379]
MNNIDIFTPNFWDDGSFNTNRAITKLKDHVTWIRIAYRFTYEGEHDYDSRLHQDFLDRLEAANTAALKNLPNNDNEVDEWIASSLSSVVLHLGFANAAACRGSDYRHAANPYIRFAEHPSMPTVHSTSDYRDHTETDDTRGIESKQFHEKTAQFQHTDFNNTEQVTIDSFVDYNASPRTITLFENLRKSFPLESDQQIHTRRLSVQNRCREILYESNPDPADYDFWVSGSKHHLKRKKPKMKYTRYSQVTKVTSSVCRDECRTNLDVHQVFMDEVRKWAYNRPLEPGETHEMIFSDAMEKYSQMLKSEIDPKHRNSYYMRSIVNNRKDIWKHRNTKKHSHEQPRNQIHLDDVDETTEPPTYDYYPSDTVDWFNSLSDRQREGIRQAVEIIDSSADERPKIPESIKRMIRGPGVPLTSSTEKSKKTNSSTEFGARAKSSMSDLREYESEEELLSKYPKHRYPVTVRFEKPTSPTIQYYAKQNKQYE